MIKPPDIEDDNWEIIGAAATGDIPRLLRLLDGDPTLSCRGYFYMPPIHFAVREGHAEVVRILLDAGADSEWDGDYGDRLIEMAKERGYDAVAAILEPARDRQKKALPTETREDNPIHLAVETGDLQQVRELLDAEPSLIREARPNGRRPLTTAVEFGHESMARFLLERGANPTWPERNADKGRALYLAARAGNRAMVELLLSFGADPNGHADSGGNAVYAAKTSEIRALLETHGGSLDPYDLVWKDEDDEVMRRVTADPKSAELGCGGVFTAVVTRGKRDLLKRLLGANIRVPPLVTGCQSYLLERPDMFRTLLESGMNPDTCNWQMQTMLHLCCRGDGSGRSDKVSLECAALLLDAGANISARDDDYCSTPLGWAARNNRPDVVDLLLARGAQTNLPDDKPWATPMAWATRRGHTQVAEILVRAGAKG
jgi:ankyrin repeat protein